MKKVIFLDRDGVINVDTGYVHMVTDWQFTPQAPEALKLLQDNDFALAIVTGQSGIGRGTYDEIAMHELHRHMNTLLQETGVHIDAIAFCPHIPEDNCECRKPKPGMAREIERQIGLIDYANSLVIGDKQSDVGFGKAIGAKTVLVKSRYWEEGDITEQPDSIVESLWEASQKILTAEREGFEPSVPFGTHL